MPIAILASVTTIAITAIVMVALVLMARTSKEAVGQDVQKPTREQAEFVGKLVDKISDEINLAQVGPMLVKEQKLEEKLPVEKKGQPGQPIPIPIPPPGMEDLAKEAKLKAEAELVKAKLAAELKEAQKLADAQSVAMQKAKMESDSVAAMERMNQESKLRQARPIPYHLIPR